MNSTKPLLKNGEYQPKGVFLMSQAAARQMVKQRNGVIVNVSSESGLEGSEGQSCYAATKAALNSFTRSGRKSWANTAFVWWALHRHSGKNRTADPDMKKRWPGLATSPSNSCAGLHQERDPNWSLRALKAEVADFVCYLLSERASYITRVTTNIAGGKTRG